jgi:hypothetical protein
VALRPARLPVEGVAAAERLPVHPLGAEPRLGERRKAILPK